MLVVYAHAIQTHTYLWNIITLFHMPLFYIISGYLNRMPSKDIRGMLIKRVIQLQIPYAVISMMVYLFTLVGNADSVVSFKSVVKYVLMIDSPPILGAIWFIGTLFYSELLFGLLDSIFCRFSINDRIQGIVYIGLLVVGMFTRFPLSLSRIPVATAYLYIGKRIRNWDSESKNSPFPRSAWLLVGGVILGVCGIFCYVGLDITDKEAVKKVIAEVKPDAVIHCAAWTAVDMAEDDDKVEKVRAVNAGGTQNIADACKAINCKMLYLSTDYVFDGQGTEPWQPDCKDYKPLNVYGQTKLEGELAVANTLDKYFIVRIAWVFGLNGKNFIKTMINVGKTHDEVRVVNDQIGTPTYCFDLARLLVDMCETEKYGYYHATNEGGYISWYDFCCEFYKQYGLSTKVIPVTTEEYGLSKAARPFNSRLDKSKLVENGFQPLPTWQDAVSRYLKEARL